MWLVVCVGCGTIAAFRLHLVLDFAVAVDLIVAAAFGLQARAIIGAIFRRAILLNFLTRSRVLSTGVPGRGNERAAFLAFLAPLFLGAATSVALELSGLTLPPLYGSGIGLFVSFALVTPLVWTYETAVAGLHHVRLPPRPARDRVLLHGGRRQAALAHRRGARREPAGHPCRHRRHRSKVGRDFALIGLAHAMIVMLGLAPFFVLVQRLSWAQAVAAAAGTAAVEMGVSGVGFLCGGIKIGLRGIYALVLLLLQVNLMWLKSIVWRCRRTSCSVRASPHPSSLRLPHDRAVHRRRQRQDVRGGVEVFTFVMVAMALGYGVGVMMIAAFNSGPNTGHLAGAVLGGLFLLCPALCALRRQVCVGVDPHRHEGLVAAADRVRSLRHLLYFAGGLALNRSIQLGAYYAAGFMGFVVLVCLRFLVACLVCWLFCVGSVRAAAASTSITSTATQLHLHLHHNLHLHLHHLHLPLHLHHNLHHLHLHLQATGFLVAVFIYLVEWRVLFTLGRPLPHRLRRHAHRRRPIAVRRASMRDDWGLLRSRKLLLKLARKAQVVRDDARHSRRRSTR